MSRVQVIQWAKPQGSMALNFTKPRAAEISVAVALGGAMAMVPMKAYAASPLTNKVIKAFDPIIDLLTAAAYPLATTMILAGFLLWIGGSRDRGMKMFRNATIGYVGLQFSPTILAFLVDIGTAMRQS